MVKEQGIVVGHAGTDVIVEVVQTSACKSCSARQGCGQAVLSEWGDASAQQAKNHFRIPYHEALPRGTLVLLGIESDTLSKVAFLVYLLPLIICFAIVSFAERLGAGEPLQLILLLVSLAASFVVVSRINTRKGQTFVPEILQVSPSGKGADLIASDASEKV